MSEPTLIHESTGLRVVKNPGNSFVVVTLHHTADPRKRSDTWRREAAAGLTPERFAKEYDIDYTALSGARVFPEMQGLRGKIIVEPPYPEFGLHNPCWGGFDYGTRNPSSFHIYTLYDGVIYSIWELFEPCKNVVEFAAKMKACPYWGNIRYISADPNIWAPTQQQSYGPLISIQECFYREGIRNLVQGNRDEEAWMIEMRKHWSTEDPTFRIFSCCPNQIREFDTAIYIEQSEKQLMSQAMKEEIHNKDNHSLDDCKYFMNSRPRQAQSGFKSPIMVDRWKVAGNRSGPQPSLTTPTGADYGRSYR